MIGLLCGNNGGLWRSLCELPVPTKNLLDPLFGFLSRRKESVVKEFFIYTDKIIRHIYTPFHPIAIRVTHKNIALHQILLKLLRNF